MLHHEESSTSTDFSKGIVMHWILPAAFQGLVMCVWWTTSERLEYELVYGQGPSQDIKPESNQYFVATLELNLNWNKWKYLFELVQESV